MSSPESQFPGRPRTDAAAPQVVVVSPPKSRTVIIVLLLLALCVSLFMNLFFFGLGLGAVAGSSSLEKYHSGDRTALNKIAIIPVRGVIMPPYTERTLKAIKQVTEDDNVKGVLLVVDSPGGLVADSHQIYHRLRELSNPTDPAKKKPIYVAMQRMAASGGYYIAMGGGEEGKIYAEPTTWTGSIGVIIPRYDVSKLAEKWDVKVDPLTTGPFKDALSPFRELSPEERAVWQGILDDAFNRFVTVIADNRQSLDADGVKKLATGQIYTADQAVANGLVDKIGYVEDAIADLKQQLGLDKVRVVTFESEPSLLEMLAGNSTANQVEQHWKAVIESTVPRSMYLCSWGLGTPGW